MICFNSIPVKLLFQLCLLLYVSSSPYALVLRSSHEKYFKTSQRGTKELFPSIDDPWSVSLSVIVPAYNEQLRCNQLYSFICNHLLRTFLE